MLRRVNGIAALLLVVVFSAHAIMGTLFCWGVVADELSWIVWIGVGTLIVHVVLSVGTTRQMFHDETRPPSAKKKEHQLKKWATGIAVGVVAAAHVLLVVGGITWAIVALLLDVALAAHVCVSAKSLAKDLEFSPHSKFVIRVLIVLVALFGGIGVCLHWS